MEPLRIFEKFKLDILDKSWTESVWNNQFIIIDKIPGDYALFAESEDMEILLKDTSIVLKTWIDCNKNSNSPSDLSEVSWQTLCALNVDPKALLALLGYLIKTGQGMKADEDSRQACLHATSLYLTLLAIPGSSAYQIFHENLYYSVVKSLELSQHLMPAVKKSVKNLDLESLYIQDEEPSSLLQTEKITLTKSLNVIMYNMILMLNSWHMRDYVRSLEQTVDSLIEVTKLGTEVSDFKSPKKVSEGSVVSLVHNAYAALGQLCDPRHGHVEVTIKLIAKNILPHMLYNYTSIPLRSLTVVRDTAIYFLKTLLFKHQKNAETGVMILIQHLMVTCPERLETRQKQASVIVKLINICCNTLYAKIIKDLVLFAHNNKIPCRIFAQEIIGKFLLDPMKDEQNSERAAATNKYKCILFGTVLSRCTDVSSMVRGRAMATLVEYTDTSNNPFIINLFSFSESERQLPTLETLLEAFDSDTVDSLLPDVNNFISMLKIRAEDERALVRRSSMQIFQNAVLNAPDLLDTVVPVVSEHCRDPAMIVRKFAIQVLTTLLESYPNHETLYKVWVKAVVPQVFDIEVKVQEKVLETMEALIIERIDKLKKNDNLPWKIIDELTVMKMRKHLTRACDAWLHSEIITNSTIRKIQSYINTEHNIAAWTLLSAIVENQTIPGMREYFENYQEILKGQGFFEFLAMEVLRCCWPTFDSNFLKKLSEDIYQSLKKATINPVLISISMDILYGVLKHLNSADTQIESRMIDLMQSSEKIIELIMNQDVKHTPVDINNYTKAICTLGHASLFSTNTIGLSSLRTLQGMLIEWERMPLSLRNARELQATAIVALGQQAMREEKIAHEMMPIFGQLLSAGVNSDAHINQRDADADAAVRVNAAKALADVCTRFTALVEPYLPDMCVSMKGDNKTVREAIVVIFIQLLVEDYIKVKGSFFFHILTMLSDPDDTIREMTVFLIKERLLVKNKTLISQQFLEGIFHYNDYELDEKYLERKMGSAERKALTLAGNCNSNSSKRRIIYDFMLEHLDPPGKLKLLVRLTTQVLHRALSDKINVNDEKGRCVLQDTFYIIASDHLQPSSCTSKHNDDDADDTTVTSTSNTGASHPGNVIADGIKKHGLNHLLPTMMKLKIKLKKINGKSKLVEDISKSIARIGTEFNKEQLSSLYNEWPEIEKEIEFDIRRYGKKGGDESSDQEFTSQTGEAVHPLLDNNRIPRIVIEKLTSLSCNDEETENLIGDEAVEARKNKNTTVVAITNFEDRSKVSSPKKRDNKYRRI